MKNRYTTIDVMAAVHDLKELEGMRVAKIYDINSKTYLIRLQKPNEKAVILFESGVRIHRTYHDWPKAQFPSSFSMKMRKHVKEKRLQDIRQLGVDRVIDMRFGDEDRAVHIIVELYDRGNILLTDCDYNILNILRPRTDKDTDVKLHVKMRYPVDMVRQHDSLPNRLELEAAFK
uniref:Nuclear export mediator factor n=1 Tax=Heterorhabditis bacteriophora TaxID=37862 RepID=A0A1I7XV10_HETBA